MDKLTEQLNAKLQSLGVFESDFKKLFNENEPKRLPNTPKLSVENQENQENQIQENKSFEFYFNKIFNENDPKNRLPRAEH